MIWAALLKFVKGVGWRGWLAIALCAALAVAAWRIDANAYARGAAAEVARQQAATERLQARFDKAEDEVREFATKIEAYKEANRMLGMEIENEFRADPEAVNRKPTDADRVRLRRWWAGQGAPAP